MTTQAPDNKNLDNLAFDFARYMNDWIIDCWDDSIKDAFESDTDLFDTLGYSFTEDEAEAAYKCLRDSTFQINVKAVTNDAKTTSA